jgi:hypothetical protein
MRRQAILIMVILAGLAGCSGTADPVPAALSTADPQLVSHLGWAGIQFGDSRADLARDHGLIQRPGDCAARLPESPALSLVLDGDRLVLLWADPPLHTPAGLMVGSPVEAVRDAHPEAEDLPAPAAPFQFPGLIVPAGDAHAYLFLHDQRVVQKLVIGYEHHARRLYHGQFGVC